MLLFIIFIIHYHTKILFNHIIISSYITNKCEVTYSYITNKSEVFFTS